MKSKHDVSNMLFHHLKSNTIFISNLFHLMKSNTLSAICYFTPWYQTQISSICYFITWSGTKILETKMHKSITTKEDVFVIYSLPSHNLVWASPFPLSLLFRFLNEFGCELNVACFDSWVFFFEFWHEALSSISIIQPLILRACHRRVWWVRQKTSRL